MDAIFWCWRAHEGNGGAAHNGEHLKQFCRWCRNGSRRISYNHCLLGLIANRCRLNCGLIYTGCLFFFPLSRWKTVSAAGANHVPLISTPSGGGGELISTITCWGVKTCRLLGLQTVWYQVCNGLCPNIVQSHLWFGMGHLLDVTWDLHYISSEFIIQTQLRLWRSSFHAVVPLWRAQLQLHWH